MFQLCCLPHDVRHTANKSCRAGQGNVPSHTAAGMVACSSTIRGSVHHRGTTSRLNPCIPRRVIRISSRAVRTWARAAHQLQIVCTSVMCYCYVCSPSDASLKLQAGHDHSRSVQGITCARCCAGGGQVLLFAQRSHPCQPHRHTRSGSSSAANDKETHLQPEHANAEQQRHAHDGPRNGGQLRTYRPQRRPGIPKVLAQVCLWRGLRTCSLTCTSDTTDPPQGCCCARGPVRAGVASCISVSEQGLIEILTPARCRE